MVSLKMPDTKGKFNYRQNHLFPSLNKMSFPKPFLNFHLSEIDEKVDPKNGRDNLKVVLAEFSALS